nr:hypothetical protein [Pandoravirus massiliensis]
MFVFFSVPQEAAATDDARHAPATSIPTMTATTTATPPTTATDSTSCHNDEDDAIVVVATTAAASPSPKRALVVGGSGWIRRRSKTGGADIAMTSEIIDEHEMADTRSPQSRTPPPSGTVACRPTFVPVLGPHDEDGKKDKEEEEDKEEEDGNDQGQDADMIADVARYTGSSVFGSLAADIIDRVETATLEVRSRPEPEGAHACALTSAHRLARLDGAAERLVEAAVQHRRHKTGLPDGRFSRLVRRKARNTKANDFVRERFRIAQGLGKHYNELFRSHANRFAGGPETAPATSGFRAKMALFWLDTLARFDSTFNVGGDLPAPSIRQPLSAREMTPLCDDPMLAVVSLTDKFDPPDERARARKRPPPRPTAPVDFSGPLARSRASAPPLAPSTNDQHCIADENHKDKEEDEDEDDSDLIDN